MTSKGGARYDGNDRRPAREFGYPVEKRKPANGAAGFDVSQTGPWMARAAAATIDEHHYRPALLVGEAEQSAQAAGAVTAAVIRVIR